ncbi:hypothetical protein MKX01_022255 [Papaver californicum]|nr:hypothetical protein MKX01_022255 [Papaver californicum]
MSFKSRGIEPPSSNHSKSNSVVTRNWAILLCLGSFCAGLLFTNRMWTVPEPEAKGITRTASTENQRLSLVSDGCVSTLKNIRREPKDVMGEVTKTHHAIQTLDKTISNLEMELAAAKATQESILNGSPISDNVKVNESTKKRKYLMIVGVNTAFSSRKRRDSVRATWMPQGEKRKKMEEEKGIITRFVIGHRSVSNIYSEKSNISYVESHLKQSGGKCCSAKIYQYLDIIQHEIMTWLWMGLIITAALVKSLC